MPLTNIKIKSLKPKEKAYKVSDEKGLFLLVTVKGSKLWRLKYRFEGKEKSLAIGSYPDVPLASKTVDGNVILGAREYRDDAKQLLASGIDPSVSKKARSDSNKNNSLDSLEVVVREWADIKKEEWTSGYIVDILRSFERNVFPWLGKRKVQEITAPEILKCLRKMEERGIFESTHRILSNLSQTFKYAISTGRMELDPSSSLRGALKPVKVKHHSALTEPEDVAGLLRMLDGYKGNLIVQCALKLAPLVFVRPGELRQAEWNDIDLNKAEWRFTVSKTKLPHIVPLSTQAIEILKHIRPLTGESKYVFPSIRTDRKPMSDNTILASFRRMGITKEEMSGHGFRAMARTMLDEQLGFKPEIIEHQLAHTVRDSLGRAYNRTTHLKERKVMMQKWSDYLDDIKGGI